MISQNETLPTVAIVNIVIINWNGAFDTKKCLSSLRDCGESNFIVTVVDNSLNQDGILAICNEFPFVKYIDAQANLGFAAGCNRGFYSNSVQSIEFTLFLNNDTVVVMPFISEIISWMRMNPNVGAVSPLINYADDVSKPWFHGSSINLSTLEMIHKNDALVEHPTIVPWLTGCAMLVSNKAFTEITGFDESFFLYYEDVDISLRLRHIGYDLYVYPLSAVLHKVSQSSNKVATVSLFYSVRNKMFVLRRHFPKYVVPGVLTHIKCTFAEIKSGSGDISSKLRLYMTVLSACWRGLIYRF